MAARVRRALSPHLIPCLPIDDGVPDARDKVIVHNAERGVRRVVENASDLLTRPGFAARTLLSIAVQLSSDLVLRGAGQIARVDLTNDGGTLFVYEITPLRGMELIAEGRPTSPWSTKTLHVVMVRACVLRLDIGFILCERCHDLSQQAPLARVRIDVDVEEYQGQLDAFLSRPVQILRRSSHPTCSRLGDRRARQRRSGSCRCLQGAGLGCGFVAGPTFREGREQGS